MVRTLLVSIILMVGSASVNAAYVTNEGGWGRFQEGGVSMLLGEGDETAATDKTNRLAAGYISTDTDFVEFFAPPMRFLIEQRIAFASFERHDTFARGAGDFYFGGGVSYSSYRLIVTQPGIVADTTAYSAGPHLLVGVTYRPIPQIAVDANLAGHHLSGNNNNSNLFTPQIRLIISPIKELDFHIGYRGVYHYMEYDDPLLFDIQNIFRGPSAGLYLTF